MTKKATPKSGSPPPTQILSVSEPTEMTSEQLRELAEGKGLAQPSAEIAEIEQKPSTLTIEPADEISSEEEPLELGGTFIEEVTHDPLKDTQRKLTQTAQELAKVKEMINVFLAEQQMRNLTTATPSVPSPEIEMPKQPQPEQFEDERSYSKAVADYSEQLFGYGEAKRRQEEQKKDASEFSRRNPDWREILPKMMEVNNEYPTLIYADEPFQKLYDIAKQKEELESYRQAKKETEDKGIQTGANMERAKKGTAFVSPSSGTGVTSKVSIPDMTDWSSDQIEKWCEQHPSLGLVKKGIY
jgi:hypothetical protein